MTDDDDAGGGGKNGPDDATRIVWAIRYAFHYSQMYFYNN